jgi:hypothetical protein
MAAAADFDTRIANGKTCLAESRLVDQFDAAF